MPEYTGIAIIDTNCFKYLQAPDEQRRVTASLATADFELLPTAINALEAMQNLNQETRRRFSGCSMRSRQASRCFPGLERCCREPQMPLAVVAMISWGLLKGCDFEENELQLRPAMRHKNGAARTKRHSVSITTQPGTRSKLSLEPSRSRLRGTPFRSSWMSSGPLSVSRTHCCRVAGKFLETRGRPPSKR